MTVLILSCILHLQKHIPMTPTTGEAVEIEPLDGVRIHQAPFPTAIPAAQVVDDVSIQKLRDELEELKSAQKRSKKKQFLGVLVLIGVGLTVFGFANSTSPKTQKAQAQVLGVSSSESTKSKTSSVSSSASISVSSSSKSVSQSSTSSSSSSISSVSIFSSSVSSVASISTQSEISQSSIYFANCTQAKAAGYYNIQRGEPGYRSALDRDNDGVACEK